MIPKVYMMNEKILPISRKNREEVIRMIVREIGLQDQKRKLSEIH